MDASPSISFLLAQPNSPANPVSQVWLNPDGSVNWEWSVSISSATGLTGLKVNGESPSSVVSVSGTDIVVNYPSSVSVGDPWVCDASMLTMSFVNAGHAVNGSGAVVDAP